MITTIFLDMDGVLADFVGATAGLFGRDPETLYNGHLRGSYDLAQALGVTTDKMWRAIDGAGEKFWAELEPYPWAHTLLAHCRRTARTVILSAPSQHPSSTSGKLRWLQSQFGLRFRDYLLGPRKDACAHHGALLIDGCADNCYRFLAAGGQAILFPRRWNALHLQQDDPCGVVIRGLAELKTGHRG